MPAGLRASTAGMTWSDVCAVYAPQSGPVRLGSFSSRRIGLGRFEFRATLAVANTISQCVVEATGPVSAMTQMLADCGINLEIHEFHQYSSGARMRTFVLIERDGGNSSGERNYWGLGTGGDATESACRAMIAGANRALEPAPACNDQS